MAHAKKPPPGDFEMFVMFSIAFTFFAVLYVFLHNWIGLLVSMYQCGDSC